jgi:enterochelin esterase-like enzyme
MLKLGAAFALMTTLTGTFESCQRFRHESWETAPLDKGQIEVTPQPDRAGLSVQRVRFFSAEMNEPRFFITLAPKGSKPTEVFILNHGWFDRPEFLLTDLKVDAAYSALLRENKVRPALIVLPDIRFDNFYRESSSRYPYHNYLTLVAVELAAAISKRYEIPFARDKWRLGGFSFGGYVSLDCARRFPGRFESVSVVSSFYDDDWSFWPAKPPDPGALDAKGRGKQTIVAPGAAPRILLACGTDDRFYSQMVALRNKLGELGFKPAWSSGPGGHTWKYWSSVLPQMLIFHLGAKAQ